MFSACEISLLTQQQRKEKKNHRIMHKITSNFIKDVYAAVANTNCQFIGLKVNLLICDKHHRSVQGFSSLLISI